jgi:hypothetical protein
MDRWGNILVAALEHFRGVRLTSEPSYHHITGLAVLRSAESHVTLKPLLAVPFCFASTALWQDVVLLLLPPFRVTHENGTSLMRQFSESDIQVITCYVWGTRKHVRPLSSIPEDHNLQSPPGSYQIISSILHNAIAECKRPVRAKRHR